MKKIIALLLALSMLFALTSCGKDVENTPTKEITDETTSTTENLKKPTLENSPTETSELIEPHKHSYDSKVTTAASCVNDGVKTFTCDCSDSYTEKIAAKGHKWSKWEFIYDYSNKNEATRTCDNCSSIDKCALNNLPGYNEVIGYSYDVRGLRFFDSISDLTAYDVFLWYMYSQYPARGDIKTFHYDGIYVINHLYPVSALDKFTKKYFGRIWDYSKISKTDGEYNAQYSYDPTSESVVVTYFEDTWDGPSKTGPINLIKRYAVIDDTHFELEYSTRYDGEPVNVTIYIQKKGDKFIITSHNK